MIEDGEEIERGKMRFRGDGGEMGKMGMDYGAPSVFEGRKKMSLHLPRRLRSRGGFPRRLRVEFLCFLLKKLCKYDYGWAGPVVLEQPRDFQIFYNRVFGWTIPEATLKKREKPEAGDIQMKVYSVPCLEDNYSYLIVDESSKEAAAVDPVEAEKVVEAAKQHGVLLKLVLTTHHHWDHAGGNDKIKQLVPGIKVYGGSLDNVKGCTDQVENGDKLVLGAHINILCLHTPCHTKGHISYYLTSKEEEELAVFTGDTLFIAGCGKFFEGTAEQMYQSLCVTLGSLPKPTRVYCGHEYTVKNLQFALTVEPDNVKIQQKITWAQHQRQAGLPTIPSTIEEEIETNPFVRVDQPEIQARVGCRSPVEALQEIRRRKDNWRG